MTYDEIGKKYPYLKDDIQYMLEWFSLSYENRNSLIFEERKESILRFKSQIVEMAKTLKEFPRDFKRVKKIYKIIKHGGNVYPIFVDDADFIMEGRHRTVSQYLARKENISVIYVSVQDETSINEIKFSKIGNIQLSLEGEDYRSEFSINDNSYLIEFHKIDDITQLNNSWSVSFRLKYKLKKDPGLDDVINMLKTNPYSNTGLGNEYKIYSYVISAIIEFINKISPNLIYFDARDKKRARVYEKIASQLLADISGYKIYSGSVINSIYSFILIKDNIKKDKI